AAALADTAAIVTVGSREPVGNFAVPGVPGRLTPDTAERYDVSGSDPALVLESIVDRLGAPESLVPDTEIPEYPPTDAITARSIGALLATNLREGAVVVDEGATNSYGYTRAAAGAAPHISLGL